MKFFIATMTLMLVAFIALTGFLNVHAKKIINQASAIRQQDKITSTNIVSTVEGKEALDNFTTEADQLKSALLAKDDLFTYISAQATKNQATAHITTQALNDADVAKKAIPITLTVQAPALTNILGFVHDIEAGKSFATIKRITYVSSSNGANTEATIDLIGYIK